MRELTSRAAPEDSLESQLQLELQSLRAVQEILNLRVREKEHEHLLQIEAAKNSLNMNNAQDNRSLLREADGLIFKYKQMQYDEGAGQSNNSKIVNQDLLPVQSDAH